MFLHTNSNHFSKFISAGLIVAKRRNEKEVSRKSVNSNFNFNYELYRQMSKEDKECTAYHEAGHFIVQKLSDNIKNYRTTAITIVPAEYFLGVTLFDIEYEKQIRLSEKLRQEIEEKINDMDDGLLCELLFQKYILGTTLEQIAIILNYSKRHIERLHIKALENFKI